MLVGISPNNETIQKLGSKSSHLRCSVRKVFLEILQNSQENTCSRVSFLIKLKASTCNVIKKEALTQMFFCEFCEIFRNTFFIEHLPGTALHIRIFYVVACINFYITNPISRMIMSTCMNTFVHMTVKSYVTLKARVR